MIPDNSQNQPQGVRSGLSHYMSTTLPAASTSRFHWQQFHHTGARETSRESVPERNDWSETCLETKPLFISLQVITMTVRFPSVWLSLFLFVLNGCYIILHSISCLKYGPCLSSKITVSLKVCIIYICTQSTCILASYPTPFKF